MNRMIGRQAALFVALAVTLLFSYQGLDDRPVLGDAGKRESTVAVNPDYRVSGSPTMYVPADVLAYPPVIAPPPGTPKSTDPTAVDSYDIKTGKRTRTPSAARSQPGETARWAEPYRGLLPSQDTRQVIGADERVRIVPTTGDPWRTVVALFITWPSGAGGQCSGSIAGCPDGHGYHVLTAGHCVFSHSQGGWATSIQAVPGMDNGYMPYYEAWATNLRSYDGWTEDEDHDYDWAFITLDRNVGDYTGWMGLYTGPSSASEYTGWLNTAGYPCDGGADCPNPIWPASTMWFHSATGDDTNEYKHWYPLDTAPGQSGSPVWVEYTDTGLRYIVSVHSHYDSGAELNCGTRLNNDKFNRIGTWCSQDAPPVDVAELIDDGVQFSSWSPGLVRPGGTQFQASSAVRNIGTAASGTFNVAYYASKDLSLEAGDYLIGLASVSSIEPFTTAQVQWSGTFPSGVPDGLYYIAWIIDGEGLVPEWDDGNNAVVSDVSLVQVDGQPPSNPTTVSESHGAINNTWQSSVADPAFTWNAVTDNASTVAGYYVYWGTDPNGTGTTWTTSAAHDPSPVSSPSTYYLRVRAKDGVGNTSNWKTLFTFKYDASPPGIPPQAHENHSVDSDVWQNWAPNPNFSWNNASDGNGSGVAGYYVYWGTDPAGTGTEWTTTPDYNPPSVPNPSVYYLRAQTKDNVGLKSNWATLFIFKYDDAGPDNPGLATEAHGVTSGAWQRSVDTPSFTWTAPSGQGSAVAKYYVYWGPQSDGSSTPYSTIDPIFDPGNPVGNPSTSYLRVMAVDSAGNSADTFQTIFTFNYDTHEPDTPGVASETHGAHTMQWQNTVSDPAFTWNDATDNGSGVLGYLVYWGPDPTGTSEEWTIDPSYDPPAVSSPSIYYLRVTTKDKAGNVDDWNTLFTFQYDSSAPGSLDAASETHGATSGVWQNSVGNPAFTWDAPDDSGSGLAGYQVYWGTDPNGVAGVWAAEPSYNPAGVTSPSVHYLRARAKDSIGNWTPWTTLFTFKYDITPPSNPDAAVESHGVVDDTWQNTEPDPAFTWSGASDGGGSGLGGYLVYWGTNPEGEGSTGISDAAYNPLAVTSPSTYYLRVATRDTTGNQAGWKTMFTFRYDATPPTNPDLTGFTHAPGDWSSINTVTVKWHGATDGSGSGLAGYACEWTTSPDSDPSGSTVITDTSATSSVLSDLYGWWVHVRALDKAGNWASEWVHWGPYLVDTTPPGHIGTVTEAQGVQNAVWQGQVADPAFSWSPFYDGGSGVAGYNVYWGTNPAGQSDDTWVSEPSYDPPAVTSGSVYYLRLQAKDEVGLLGAWATCFTYKYENTPPSNPTTVTEVHAAADKTWQSTVDNPAFNWSGAADEGGSGLDGTYVYWGPMVTGTATTWAGTGYYDAASVPSSSTYYLRVQTRDNAGNTAPWETVFTLRYDADLPSNPTSTSEMHFVPTDLWQRWVADPAFTWEAATDAGAGVAGYYVYWGTNSAGTSSTWSSTTGFDPGMVGSPSIHYLRVATRDQAGNTAPWVTLYTLKYDSTPPSLPLNGNEIHGAPGGTWQNVVADPAFTWSESSDGLGSGVAGYNVYWGPVPQGTGTAWTTEPGYDPVEVLKPLTYYLRIQAQDMVGNTTAWDTRFVFMYDAVPPTNPVVSSSSHSVDKWSTNGTLAVSWSGAADDLSGVEGYTWARSREPMMTLDATVMSSSTLTSVTFDKDGTWYFFLNTSDKAGNWAPRTVRSGPYRIDRHAPTCTVQRLPASVRTSFVVSWSGADPEPGSGIAGYDVQYRIGSVGAWQPWITTRQTSATFGPSNPTPTVSGRQFTFRCRARDNAGNVGAYGGENGDTSTIISFNLSDSIRAD